MTKHAHALAAATLLLVPALALAEPLPAPAALRHATQVASAAHPLPAGTRSTRDLLLAIAEHESHFSLGIMRCATKGDHGLAHGAYQLHPEAFGAHTPDEVCASDELQAKLALAVLARYLQAFPELGVRGAVRGFASGNPRKDTRAAREILSMWKERRSR